MNGSFVPRQVSPIKEATNQRINQVQTGNESFDPMVARQSMNSQAGANALTSVASGT